MLLHALVLSPFIAALLMTATSQRDGKSAARLALWLGLVPLGLVTALFKTGAHVTKALNWFVLPGSDTVVHYVLMADGLSLWLSWLTAVLTVLALLASRSALGERYREFAVGLFVLEGAILGTFLAADALLFFFFFEAMIIPAAILIAAFGGENRKPAAMTFAIYTLAGSAPMAFGLWYVIAVTGSTDPTLLAERIAQLPFWVQDVLFWVFALAFMVKTPVFPFHGWQAKSYAEAPATLTAILSGAMAKAGLFGFAAWVLPLFSQSAERQGQTLVWLGLFSLLYGALMALRQNDAKKVLAFSSLSHLGLAVAGIFSLHQGAFAGVLLLLVAHGLSAGAQFLLCGMAERWTGSRSLAGMGAFASTNPVYAFLFGAAGIAAVAVPGSAGFVGEFIIIQALWESVGPLAALLAGLGIILSAVYTLRLLQAFLFGPAVARRQGASLSVSEALAVFPLVAMLIYFGVHPAPVLNSVRPAPEVAKYQESATPSVSAEVVQNVP
jgi:NADH-quinone oxidoreductase subunit M